MGCSVVYATNWALFERPTDSIQLVLTMDLGGSSNGVTGSQSFKAQQGSESRLRHAHMESRGANHSRLNKVQYPGFDTFTVIK